MNSKDLKRVLAGLSIAGLLAAPGLAGCTTTGKKAGMGDDIEKSRTSCSGEKDEGKSSCTGEKPEKSLSSCTGEKPDDGSKSSCTGEKPGKDMM